MDYKNYFANIFYIFPSALNGLFIFEKFMKSQKAFITTEIYNHDICILNFGVGPPARQR